MISAQSRSSLATRSYSCRVCLTDSRVVGQRGHQLANAFFDALGDDDLAFTGEQLHRAHLAHVHAHRVGGAAGFCFHGGQCSSGLGRGDFVCERSPSDISNSSASGAASNTWMPMSLIIWMMSST